MLFAMLKRDAEKTLNEAIHQGGGHHPRQLQGPGPSRHQALRRRRRLAGFDADQRTDRRRHLLWLECPAGSNGFGLRFRRRHPGCHHACAFTTACSRKSAARASASSAATTSITSWQRAGQTLPGQNRLRYPELTVQDAVHARRGKSQDRSVHARHPPSPAKPSLFPNAISASKKKSTAKPSRWKSSRW